MGKLDTLMRTYLSHPDICADFIQHFVFNNSLAVTEDMLQILDSRQSSKDNRHHFTKERYRDLFISVRDKTFCLVTGIENQTDLSNIMPVRSMGYDVAHYEQQISTLKHKHHLAGDLSAGDFLSGIAAGEKLTPVITLVFYYGEEPWDRSTKLWDMLDFSGIEPYTRSLVADYRINLIDIHKIEDTCQFKTPLGILIGFMKIRKYKDKLKNYIKDHSDFFSHISSDLFDLLCELMHSQWLIDAKNHYFNNKGEFDMCTGMKDWIAEVETQSLAQGLAQGKAIGLAEGKNIGLIQGQDNGLRLACLIMNESHDGMTPAAIAEKLQVDSGIVSMILKAMGI